MLKTRREKQQWMRDQIVAFFNKKPKGTISKSKLLASFALDNATTRRAGLEILGLLRDIGQIKIEGDLIYR